MRKYLIGNLILLTVTLSSCEKRKVSYIEEEQGSSYSKRPQVVIIQTNEFSKDSN